MQFLADGRETKRTIASRPMLCSKRRQTQGFRGAVAESSSSCEVCASRAVFNCLRPASSLQVYGTERVWNAAALAHGIRQMIMAVSVCHLASCLGHFLGSYQEASGAHVLTSTLWIIQKSAYHLRDSASRKVEPDRVPPIIRCSRMFILGAEV